MSKSQRTGAAGSGVLFDPGTGRLRLPPAEFTALLEYPGTDAAPLTDLTAAGVLGDAGPHPLLLPGLTAVHGPVCRLFLHVAGAAGVHLHHGWVDAEAAAFLLHVREGQVEFVTVGPTFVPAAIARVLRLAPRPPLGLDGFGTHAEVVDGLFAENSSERNEALTALRAAASGVRLEAWETAVQDRTWRACRAAVSWTGPDGEPAGRDVAILDTPAGILRVDRAEPPGISALWTPTSMTSVWRSLTALLPGDEELIAAAS